MALAFFDLDGTLTRSDSFVPYCLIALLHRPWRIGRVKAVLGKTVRFLRGEIDRQSLKEAFVGVFLGGATRKDVARWNTVFFRAVLPLVIRRWVLRRARQHQRRGDRVYVVSASPDIYLQPLVEKLGLDGLICTRLECKEGRLTGKLLGSNCHGKEKATRIKALFSAAELKGSVGYGNSEGDRQMLNLVSEAHPVGSVR
jgi:phosphatidylglycerophosphatase C